MGIDYKPVTNVVQAAVVQNFNPLFTANVHDIVTSSSLQSILKGLG
jgi:hypothetical protein